MNTQKLLSPTQWEICFEINGGKDFSRMWVFANAISQTSDTSFNVNGIEICIEERINYIKAILSS